MGEGFYGRKFALTSPDRYLPVMYVFLLLIGSSLRSPSLQLLLNSELKDKSSVAMEYLEKLFQQQYPSKDLQWRVNHLLFRQKYKVHPLVRSSDFLFYIYEHY